MGPGHRAPCVRRGSSGLSSLYWTAKLLRGSGGPEAQWGGQSPKSERVHGRGQQHGHDQRALCSCHMGSGGQLDPSHGEAALASPAGIAHGHRIRLE